ncbi:MAG: hypothetical protein ACK5QT_08825, partial [Oligoflexia bacterium]
MKTSKTTTLTHTAWMALILSAKVTSLALAAQDPASDGKLKLIPLKQEVAERLFDGLQIKRLPDGSIAITGLTYKECEKFFKIEQGVPEGSTLKKYFVIKAAKAELEACVGNQKKLSDAERLRLSTLPNAKIENPSPQLRVGWINLEQDPPVFHCVDCGPVAAPGNPGQGVIESVASIPEEISQEKRLEYLEEDLSQVAQGDTEGLLSVQRRTRRWIALNEANSRTDRILLAVAERLSVSPNPNLEALDTAAKIYQELAATQAGLAPKAAQLENRILLEGITETSKMAQKIAELAQKRAAGQLNDSQLDIELFAVRGT